LRLVDCNVALKSAVLNLSSLIKETAANIEAQNLPTIESHDVVIVQLFQNLVSNALKYRSDALPLIKIGAERGPDGWTFSVRDNGIGIDSKYFDYVFGVFKRLHGREYSGTGIGLAICKVAVERLGGKIWVESSPGQGSCFRFFLPEMQP
jgi:light-regulated signal transduction histidine kinase (bacteriophytochrome)